MKFTIKKGSPDPLGANKKENGINFALFSEHATSVTLSLFSPGGNQPFAELILDSQVNRTGHIWHILVEGLPEHTEYGYRINESSLLISDPYAKLLNTTRQWKAYDKDHPYQPRGKIATQSTFQWNNDVHPNIAPQDLVIYEMHVRGFTHHSSSRVKHPGTFLGIVEKIPYFKKIGVNAIELLPVFEFNECENKQKNPKTGKQLVNFWGYSTVNFFTPMNRYATNDQRTSAIDEFKTMVKELHKNGIEVILDVVYNHTAEGNETGSILSFKEIDNSVYYILDKDGKYLNFSGTGNTFNCNHPIVMRLILDSLRYWAGEMRVDGFRFDLASILTRGIDGEPLSAPPLIEAIMYDPILANTKLIAEAWDAAGLYQVGNFPGEGWSEWNGKYRDCVRRFIKGTDGEVGNFAKVVSGSQFLYGHNRKPFNSINFVTCHDGYTLHDLVTFQDKHNEENGENNQDGANDNESWNCGVEGPTTNRKIDALRAMQMRNLHLALMVSIGTPMIHMGDEYGHTKNGNNNTYCQDSESNWFLWDAIPKSADFFRFFTLVNQWRSHQPLLHRRDFLSDQDVEWHGKIPSHPDWSPQSRFVAWTLKDHVHEQHLYIAFNAHFESAHIQIPPPPPHMKWYRIIDTSLHSPDDFVEKPHDKPPLKFTYDLPSHAALVLQAL